MRLATLAGRQVSPSLRACHRALDPTAPEDYRQLAALLADVWRETRPRAVGIGGGQGAGKSTLSQLVARACGEVGLKCATLSLDDFYLARAEREALARRVHPLFETRGPPGTHEVGLCRESLRGLTTSAEVRIPIFDKGSDDRSGWRSLQGPFDLVLLEGWCVGARPGEAAALETPLNALEAEQDPEALWRRHAWEQLAGPYAQLFAELEALVYLRVPNLAAVRRWRLQQESERPPEQRLDADAIDRFVQHYERITLGMQADLPARAGSCVELDEDHRVCGLRIA